MLPGSGYLFSPVDDKACEKPQNSRKQPAHSEIKQWKPLPGGRDEKACVKQALQLFRKCGDKIKQCSSKRKYGYAGVDTAGISKKYGRTDTEESK